MTESETHRERTNTVIACCNLLAGWTLTFIDYFVSTAEGVHESVLWVLGQTFIFAGCLLGVKTYVDYKIQERK